LQEAVPPPAFLPLQLRTAVCLIKKRREKDEIGRMGGGEREVEIGWSS